MHAQGTSAFEWRAGLKKGENMKGGDARSFNVAAITEDTGAYDAKKITREIVSEDDHEQHGHARGF